MYAKDWTAGTCNKNGLKTDKSNSISFIYF